ncbi:MAG: hypothetical protein HY921_03045 [Elusimicrobia bacterium]|nr:hypothetical protein [Elusimicrobiota bacterium]
MREVARVGVDWESFARLFVFSVLLLAPPLIAAAARGGFLWFAVPAGIGFAVVNGLAVYGSIQKWEWLEWKTWSRFYGMVTIISVLELLLFIAFVQGT